MRPVQRPSAAGRHISRSTQGWTSSRERRRALPTGLEHVSCVEQADTRTPLIACLDVLKIDAQRAPTSPKAYGGSPQGGSLLMGSVNDPSTRQQGTADRARRARLAALVRWSKSDSRVGTAKARAGFLERFEREVREAAERRGEMLAPDEISRRAQRAMRAHMVRLARRSADARRKRT
jgi:hypothetical protein